MTAERKDEVSRQVETANSAKSEKVWKQNTGQIRYTKFEILLESWKERNRMRSRANKDGERITMMTRRRRKTRITKNDGGIKASIREAR